MGTGDAEGRAAGLPRDGRNDCDGCFTASFSPLQPSQLSRGLFVFGYEGQRDTPPFVPDFVLIADVVFIQQPARLHIQILSGRSHAMCSFFLPYRLPL